MATNRTPDSYATTPQPVNTEDGSLSVNSDLLRDDVMTNKEEVM